MKRRIYISILLVFALILILNTSSFSQNRDSWFPPPFPFLNREIFFIDPLVFYMKDSSEARLDLYIEIPVSNLLFKRNSVNDNFESSLDLTVIIKDLKEQIIFDKTEHETITYTDEEMKNECKNSIYFIKQYYLNPDFYKINLTVRDNNLNKDYSAADSINVKNFQTQNILLSDIMILSDYSTDVQGNKEITPLINNNVFGLKEFYIFFEIYNITDSSINKEYSYRIKDAKEKTISEGTFAYFLSKNINKEFEKIDFINHEPGFFRLEITDKSSLEVVSIKDFVFFPHHYPLNEFPEERHSPEDY